MGSRDQTIPLTGPDRKGSQGVDQGEGGGFCFIDFGCIRCFGFGSWVSGATSTLPLHCIEDLSTCVRSVMLYHPRDTFLVRFGVGKQVCDPVGRARTDPGGRFRKFDDIETEEVG